MFKDVPVTKTNFLMKNINFKTITFQCFKIYCLIYCYISHFTPSFLIFCQFFLIFTFFSLFPHFPHHFPLFYLFSLPHFSRTVAKKFSGGKFRGALFPPCLPPVTPLRQCDVILRMFVLILVSIERGDL